MSHSSQADSSVPDLDAMSTLPSSAGPQTPAQDQEEPPAVATPVDWEQVAARVSFARLLCCAGR